MMKYILIGLIIGMNTIVLATQRETLDCALRHMMFSPQTVLQDERFEFDEFSGGIWDKNVQVTYKYDDHQGLEKTIYVSETTFPRSSWTKERWSVEGKDETYDFLDIGPNRFLDDLEIVEREYARELLSHGPGVLQSLTIKSEGAKRAAENGLARYRRLVLEKAMEVYRRDLGNEKLGGLKSGDRFSRFVDMYVLKRPKKHTLHKMSDQEFKDDIEAAIQMHYSDEPFYPRVRQEPFYSLFRDDFLVLPFQFRIRVGGKFQRRFLKRYGGKKLVELTRYIKPNKKLSPEMSDAFMYKVFLRAQEKGVETIMATVDSKAHERLYKRRYKFETFAKLPFEKELKGYGERLLVLDTQSEQFRDALAKLKESYDRISPESLSF